ncbi:MAG: exosortase C-terminal domain/associated protein EpsI [Gemmatimonadota bacterium]
MRAPGWVVALAPVPVLLVGVAGRSLLEPARPLALRASLAGLPRQLGSFGSAEDLKISRGELRVLNPEAYLLRSYRDEVGDEMSLFVAFYGRQARGSSIHSPRNCLPGAGWEPVEHRRVKLRTAYGTGTVNEYVIEHESGRRALVYYWYQGRGRVEANEYLVKWQMLRDALVKRRTDEALVRLVIPIEDGASPRTEVPDSLLRRVADSLRDRLPA